MIAISITPMRENKPLCKPYLTEIENWLNKDAMKKLGQAVFRARMEWAGETDQFKVVTK